MEVKIGAGAYVLLNRYQGFTDKLIRELSAQRFANVCFIDGPGAEGSLEIRCLGGEGVTVPESRLGTPGIPGQIIDQLAMQMK